MHFFIYGLLLAVSFCGVSKPAPTQDSETQTIGSTCFIEPILRRDDGSNPCFWPKPSKVYFPGHIVPAARYQAVNMCKEANRLDYGNEASPPGSCSKECEKQVWCVPLTNPNW